MTDEFRVGILSTAHVHTGPYASAIASFDDAELVGVADEDDARGQAFAAEYGTELVDADSLLEAVDGAVICSTNASHRPWVERAADAGVDVLCEKPLAPSIEDARAIVDVASSSGIAVGVAMPLRFCEPARRAKARVDGGTVGELQTLVGTNRGSMPGGWFVDADRSGGGAVMDHSVHIVDLVHWITDKRVESVYAETDTRFHEIPVEDVNVLSMTLADGTAFTLDGSWSKPERWHFWGDATLELVGTDGSITVDCFDQTYWLTRDAGESPGIDSVYWGSNPDAGLLRDFVESMQTGRSPAIPAEDGMAAVAVVEAAYESAATGEPIIVDYGAS